MYGIYHSIDTDLTIHLVLNNCMHDTQHTTLYQRPLESRHKDCHNPMAYYRQTVETLLEA